MNGRFNGWGKPFLASVITVIGMMAGPVLAWAYGYGSLNKQVESNTEQLEKHEVVVQSIDVMQERVKRILKRLDDLNDEIKRQEFRRRVSERDR